MWTHTPRGLGVWFPPGHHVLSPGHAAGRALTPHFHPSGSTRALEEVRLSEGVKLHLSIFLL